MRKYLIEFIGTFFLMLLIFLAIGQADTTITPLAIALGLTALVYMGGHISGAHYNPAVTLAFLLHGDFAKREVIPYLLAQVVAVLLAGPVALYLLQHTLGNTLPLTTLELMVGPALLAELLGTFLLVLVILQVAKTDAASGQSYYGLAIGFVVGGLAFTIGPISAGAFNPAVALGFCAVGLVSWSDLWLFLVAEVLGSVLAWFTFSYTYQATTN